MESIRERIIKIPTLEALDNMDYELMEKCVKEIEEILNIDEEPEVLEIYRNGLMIELEVLKANLEDGVQIKMF